MINASPQKLGYSSYNRQLCGLPYKFIYRKHPLNVQSHFLRNSDSNYKSVIITSFSSLRLLSDVVATNKSLKLVKTLVIHVQEFKYHFQIQLTESAVLFNYLISKSRSLSIYFVRKLKQIRKLYSQTCKLCLGEDVIPAVKEMCL